MLYLQAFRIVDWVKPLPLAALDMTLNRLLGAIVASPKGQTIAASSSAIHYAIAQPQMVS